MNRKAHWETIYATKAPDEVSWYQASPDFSLALISATGAGKDARIIDIGGGASRLVDALVEAGFTKLTVLDISPTALRRARERLGGRAGQVTWLEADVTAGPMSGTFDVWHDRAVFHFLTEAGDRARYVSAAERALSAGGHLILATFAPDGPPRCSGLPVTRYSAEDLRRELGVAFELVETRTEQHATPMNVRQSFLYARFKKRPAP